MDIAMKTDEEWTVDGNTVLNFRLIRDVKDLEATDGDFPPTMCHQIFGPQELIYGYKNLAIQLYFSAAFLNPYLKISYSDKISVDNENGVEADDIEAILTESLKISFMSNIDEFSRLLKNEPKFRPMGEQLKAFTINSDEIDKNYVVYKTEASAPGFVDWHNRLQTFLLWFVDSASFIDIDDEKWQFFLLFEKYVVNGSVMYAVAGYTTVYEYFAYPQNLRPRLSQMLILPPFQRQGLGTEMLKTIFEYYRAKKDVVDITVEDPSEDFQTLRDFIDCRDVMNHTLVKDVKPITLNVVLEAAKSLKINKKQARRVYEILGLKGINRNHPEEYRAYRLQVKNRLNVPYHYKKRRMHQFESATPDVYAALHDGQEHRWKILCNKYEALEEAYSRVIQRLENDYNV